MLNKTSIYKKRIVNYSLIAGGIITVTESSKAEITYTDLDPDSILQMNNDTFFLDLNQDNTTDFLITLSKSNVSFSKTNRYIEILPQGSNSIIATTGNIFPKVINKGDTSANPYIWANNNLLILNAYAWSTGTQYYLGGVHAWSAVNNKFIGLRIKSSADTLYGWLRLDVDTLAQSVTIKDFAYETIPQKRITYGLAVDTISNLSVSDIGDVMNGSDLRVSFDRAIDETNIEHYEVFIVKSLDADAFNIDSAMSVADSNKTTIPKSGSDISIALSPFTRDIDGDLIENDETYKVFVLSKAISGSALYFSVLSAPSQGISLTSIFADIASDLTVQDVSNNGDGRDIEIAFTKAIDENTIDEYRIIVIKAEDSLTFNLETANSVAPGNYTVISKQGIDITTSLSSSAKDKDDDIITESQSYIIYVLSVADGVNAGLNSLSAPSNTILLSSSTGIKKNHAFLDAIIIANTMNGLFIQIPQEINLSKGDFIRIIDLSGRVIQQIPLENHKTFIDINAQTGQYIVEVHTNDAVHNRMIQHFDK